MKMSISNDIKRYQNDIKRALSSTLRVRNRPKAPQTMIPVLAAHSIARTSFPTKYHPHTLEFVES